MGLLLCTKRADHPFYYEKLDKNLWSIQELCYILYRYPIVIPENFVDEKLCQWISAELDMKYLAEKLQQFLSMGEEQDRLILRILREGNYYTEREIQDFGVELRRLKEIDRSQFQELLADTYFRMGKYGKAVESYQEAISGKKSPSVTMKLADSFVTVMQFDKAAELYEDVYRETGNTESLRKLYYLEKLDPTVHILTEYVDKLDTGELASWENSYNVAEHGAMEDPEVEEIRRIYELGDEGFREEAGKLIREWKRLYRDKA